MNPKLSVPLGLLVLGAVIAVLLVAMRPAAERRPQVPVAPLVRALVVRPGPVQLAVTAHGTVAPRSESALVAQVAGEITWVSPRLVSGGFFAASEELLRVDPTDYQVALESAQATVVRTGSEAARARKERDRQRQLADRSVASQARIDDAESAYRQAAAQLRAARAQLRRAERDLERTTLRAPYDGRVRQERVDVGQFVNRGDTVATVYAIDSAEVRLPIPDRELSYLDVSLAHGKRPLEGDAAPSVVLRAEFAGEFHEWQGRIVRTEGELDPKSRMVHVVAGVDDPYGRDAEGETVPLAVGLFVEAEIRGRRVERAYVVPRTALYDDRRVLVIDAENRLHFRDVEVVRLESDTAILAEEGLRSGERICTSPLVAPVEGMHVRVLDDSGEDVPDAEPAAAPAQEART